ncbi:MAG: hypothetical protein KTR13_06020 [Saprospiraceae bacterium]|nr:hypothetical protein [Saprospiraceae bacterium]
MRVKDIAHACTTTILIHDSLETIERKFQLSELEFLPVVNEEGWCYGAILKTSIQFASPNHFSVNDMLTPLYVSENRHIIEGIRNCIRKNAEGLLLVDEEGFLMGYVQLKELFHHFALSSGLMENGSMLIAEIQQNKFSISEVSKIVESNGASILHLYVSMHPEAQFLQITMILNTSELQDIISSFERFRYTILYSSSSTERDDLMKERYNSLMHYLDI